VRPTASARRRSTHADPEVGRVTRLVPGLHLCRGGGSGGGALRPRPAATRSPPPPSHRPPRLGRGPRRAGAQRAPRRSAGPRESGTLRLRRRRAAPLSGDVAPPAGRLGPPRARLRRRALGARHFPSPQTNPPAAGSRSALNAPSPPSRPSGPSRAVPRAWLLPGPAGMGRTWLRLIAASKAPRRPSGARVGRPNSAPARRGGCGRARRRGAAGAPGGAPSGPRPPPPAADARVLGSTTGGQRLGRPSGPPCTLTRGGPRPLVRPQGRRPATRPRARFLLGFTPCHRWTARTSRSAASSGRRGLANIARSEAGGRGVSAGAEG
jgi:hypothetical protein